FHLMVGKPPFDADGMGEILAAHLREPAPAPSSRCPGIPPEVDAIVLHCLEKDPAARFQDMSELAGAIGQVLPYLTAPGSPGSSPPAYHAGATPPPAWSRPPSVAPPTTPGTRPPSTTPTTLGSSTGQVAGTQTGGRKKAPWLVVAAVVVAGGA